MNIISAAQIRDSGLVRSQLEESAAGRRIVPIIGSGFTCGLESLAGNVPNADELKSSLALILYSEGLVDDEELEALNDQDLSDVSDHFLGLLYERPRMSGGVVDHTVRDARRNFKRYFEDNFTSVRGLSSEQRMFLQCGWPYLYTLNFDDAIERVIGEDYKVVAPFSDIDATWLKDNDRCLIKLHGDVREVLKTNSVHRRLVLDKGQYLSFITDEKNATLFTWLKEDLSSKDLLFVGCGLNNEYDILFAEADGIRGLSGRSSTNSYYVYYDKDGTGRLPAKDKMNLRKYGVQNVIVTPPEELSGLYEDLARLYRENAVRSRGSDVEDYARLGFTRLVPSQSQARVFSNQGLVSKKQGDMVRVELPSFLVRRDVVRKVHRGLRDGTRVSVLYGRRYSGKTHALLDLAEWLQADGRTVYLFCNVELADSAIEELSGKRDCVMLFDTGSITDTQVSLLLSGGIEELREREVQIVLAVNRSDRHLIEAFAYSNMHGNMGYRGYFVSEKLSERELRDFNSCVSVCALSDRGENETFLDYALRIDDEVLAVSHSLLPREYALDDDVNMLVAFIALAVHPTLSVKTVSVLGVTSELAKLSDEVEQAVQVDFIGWIERGRGTHGCMKYLSNSLYWLAKSLSTYASVEYHYRDIVAAMQAIMRRLQRLTGTSAAARKEFYRRAKPYLIFDTLDEVFFPGDHGSASAQLLLDIYGGLTDVMGDSYQYLHQYGKCCLRASRTQGDLAKRVELLTNANHLLSRAFDLAGSVRSDSVEYTLAHIKVTQALVYTNYLKYCNPSREEIAKRLGDAVDCYHYAFVEHPERVDNQLARDEAADSTWFAQQLMRSEDGSWRDLMNRNHLTHAGEVLSAMEAVGGKNRIRIHLDSQKMLS